MVNIRKRGKVYQYQFEIAKVDGKRKYITKSGFKTKDDKGRWFLGTTKTEGSCREVFICDTLYKILSNYKEGQKLLKKKYGKKYKKYELEAIENKYGKINEYKIVESKYKGSRSVEMVFKRDNGSYAGTDIIKYPFKIIHNELGIKNSRFYDLRGSYATKCLYSGIEIKDIAYILGHSRIETTENYYISSTLETRKKVCNVLENIIDSKIINEIIDYNKF